MDRQYRRSRRPTPGGAACDAAQQLVSSVTHGLGLSIIADGQKIYYGRLMPDSTCIVWEMNRWGREKRQVTFAGSTSAVKSGEAAGSATSLKVRDGEFVGELVLSIEMQRADDVDVVVVAIDGREVARLLRKEYLAAGRHERVVLLEGLARGTYLVSIKSAATGKVVSTKFVVGS